MVRRKKQKKKSEFFSDKPIIRVPKVENTLYTKELFRRSDEAIKKLRKERALRE